jgi:hypothetical protein
VEGCYKILKADKEMRTKDRQDEAVAGDYRVDIFGKRNDGTDGCGRAWSFFSSAAMTTSGVIVGYYYTS